MSAPNETGEGGWRELEAALDAREAEMTPAERAVAGYLRRNRAAIPYETGASMAAASGVSEMTVIRFIRALGYANLRELKERLRPRGPDDAQALDDVLERFRLRRDDLAHLERSLELELRAVTQAYALATGERWPRIVELLAGRRFVHVAGFQATRGVALDFANRLKYARPGVRFAEGSAGIYSEVLESDPAKVCLMIVDTVSYARKGVLLARKAREQGIPLVVVTDRFSHWALEHTDLVLEVNTYVETFWDSTAALSVVLNLLINSVAARRGDEAVARFQRLVRWGDYFQEFDAAASRRTELSRRRQSEGR